MRKKNPRRKRRQPNLFLIERCWEFVDQTNARKIPKRTRGIYALLNKRKRRGSEHFDVVYVGMARGGNAGIRGRLRSHLRSKSKRDKWSHFSAFKVWDNIPAQIVAEMEGVLREIYRKDSRANQLNKQKKHKPLQRVRVRQLGTRI